MNVDAHGDDLGDGDFEYGQQPYANEPLADEAWLENYERETEQERRQFEEYTQNARRNTSWFMVNIYISV